MKKNDIINITFGTERQTQPLIMSIQNDLKRIEKEIEQLKSNELPIEDQIKRYADALKDYQSKSNH